MQIHDSASSRLGSSQALATAWSMFIVSSYNCAFNRTRRHSASLRLKRRYVPRAHNRFVFLSRYGDSHSATFVDSRPRGTAVKHYPRPTQQPQLHKSAPLMRNHTRTTQPGRAGLTPDDHRRVAEAPRRCWAAVFRHQGEVIQPIGFWQREQPFRLAGCAMGFAPGTGRGFAWFRSAHQDSPRWLPQSNATHRPASRKRSKARSPR